ncbi:hypothetical protein [Priestia megaterium]|uniref:hypothetical protein n=1 Tax=Priestia megaterium TaxID=1404 RepID=UPI003CC6676C
MVIIVGLLLLMFFAYLGWSIIWVAPVVATFVAYFSGLKVLSTYTDVYMGGFVDFAAKWFPIFFIRSRLWKANGRYRRSQIVGAAYC